MTSPNHQLGGGGTVEVFKGAFYVPDFEDAVYHDGSLVHYSHLITTAEELGLQPRDGGRAFNQVYGSAVHVADQARIATRSTMEPVGARKLDWRYNVRSRQPDQLQKRLRIFLTNDLVADTFYDHIVPESSDWPSRYLDVIESLLKVRGYDRQSEKREAQLARRAELS